MRARSGSGSTSLLIELDSLQVLLVIEFFLDVLVSLEQLVVLVVSNLQLLRHESLLLFSKGVHLVLLLLDKFGFSGNDFLVSLVHVLFVLVSFELLAADLDLMGLRISKHKFKRLYSFCLARLI